jgi:type IV secretion system protein VirB10
MPDNPSLVSEEPGLTPKKLLIYTMLGTMLVIVSMGFIFSKPHKEQKEIETATNTINTKDINRALAENLATLERINQQTQARLNQEKSALSPPSVTITNDTPSQEPSVNQPNEASIRAFRARLNAPTLMYSAEQNAAVTLPITNAQNVNNNVSNAIYAGKGSNAAFINQTSESDTTTATSIKNPDYTVASGEMIHAALETAINSDLPGSVRAVVTMPVYAYIGNQPLIPAGSRLLGQYASSVVQGQQRILVVWNRVLLPDGTTAQLDSPSTDPLGQSGQGADSVETHFWSRFGQATLLSILGAGAANVGVNGGDQYNSASEYRSAITQSLNDSAAASLQNTINNSPTLHIEQGAAINVFVTRDLSFYDVMNRENNNV